MWGAQCLLEVRRRFWVGSGRPSMLMLVRSAAALATMRPILLMRVLKKRYLEKDLFRGNSRNIIFWGGKKGGRPRSP